MPLPVTPPEFWVASRRRRLVGADQRRSCRLCRRDRLKPEAALRRAKAACLPWQGGGWALAPRDRGPEAGMCCWMGHYVFGAVLLPRPTVFFGPFRVRAFVFVR
jgi:hypothetical protein